MGFPSPTDGTALAQEMMRRKALQPQMPEAPEPSAPGAIAQPPAPALTQLAAPSKVRGLGPLPGSPEGNNSAELQRLQSSPSGIGQMAAHPGLGHHIAGHALQIADAIGSAFFPAIAAGIPGTQLHHNVLIHQAAGNVARDQQAQTAQDEQGYKQAQTAHAQAQADEIVNPHVAPQSDIFKALPTATGYGSFNERKGTLEPLTMNGQTAQPPEKAEKEKQIKEFTGADGKVYSLEVDDQGHPIGRPIKMEGGGDQLQGKVNEGNDFDKYFADLVKTGVKDSPQARLDARKEYAAAGQKPPTVNVSTGSFTMAEDTEGHPVLFNSKTGQTKPIEGVQARGTFSKNQAAEEKRFGPARDAVAFANDYVQHGVATGPKDEVLMEKFFEVAKPSTGFRMTQSQQQMLKDSRSWMGSLQGKAYHAATGTWFSPKQRKEIVDAMNEVANTRGGSPSSSTGMPHEGGTFNGHKVLKVEKVE